MNEHTINNEQIFERYELKYLLSPKQKDALLHAMEPYMQLDAYGRTTIRNIYYDTPDYRLIRNSIEKPIYKEKLRVRSYKQAGAHDTVFVELKKKYDDVVYKRRISMERDTAARYLCGKEASTEESQISREIDYFLSFYKELQPTVFLSYEREAFFAKDGSDFRITLDRNILYREDHLSLGFGAYGTAVLPHGATLLEIKTSGAIPLWLVRFLSDRNVQKTSFSKYGEAYEQIFTKEREVYKYA